MHRSGPQAPPAQVTLRAHPPAPARVELVYQPLPGRFLRASLALLVCWGAVPVLVWVPPHYPWVVAALALGAYLAYGQWSGRYQVRAFAGICPRCGSPLSLAPDHAISLPHTLTCYRCHFEPLLEVRFAACPPDEARPEHRTPECTGRWGICWLADEAFVLCERCHAHAPASPPARAAADAENERADLLERLTREGGER